MKRRRTNGAPIRTGRAARSGTMRRKNQAKKTLDASAVALQALGIAKKLERQRELKIHDVGTTTNDLNTTVVPLDTFARVDQGDNSTQRDGKVITPTSLRLKIVSTWGGTAQLLRVTILRWVSGVTPTGNVYYETVGINAHKRRVERKRQHWLFDQVFHKTDGLSQDFYDIKVPLKNRNITYTEQQTSFQENGIIVLISNNTGGAGSGHNVAIQGRMMFYDL